MMLLAITTNSFHFKYYLMLCKMWDIRKITDKYDARMSLCIYSQFIFWMSIATILLSPFILLGWLILKLSRLGYKICSWTKPGRFFMDFLDNVFDLSFVINKASENMVAAPVVNLIKIAGAVLFTTLVIFMISFIAIAGIVGLISIFMNIPEYIAGFFYCVCVVFFHIFAAIGYAIAKALFWSLLGLKWFGLMLLMSMGGIALVAGLLALTALFAITLFKAALAIEPIKDFFGFKINGFQKAKEEAIKRRKEIAIQLEIEEENKRKEKEKIREMKDRGEIPFSFLEKAGMAINESFVKFGSWFKRTAFEKKAKVKGGNVKIMSGLGVVWETLKSFKQGVCPFVEFIDAEDVEDIEEDNKPKGGM